MKLQPVAAPVIVFLAVPSNGFARGFDRYYLAVRELAMFEVAVTYL